VSVRCVGAAVDDVKPTSSSRSCVGRGDVIVRGPDSTTRLWWNRHRASGCWWRLTTALFLDYHVNSWPTFVAYLVSTGS